MNTTTALTNAAFLDPSADKLDLRLLKSVDDETAFLHELDRMEAQSLARYRERQVDQLVRKRADELAADRTVQAQVAALANDLPQPSRIVTDNAFIQLLRRIRLCDYNTLITLTDHLPEWYARRLKWVYGQVNWKTSKGQPGFFNKAAATGIPVAERLAILAAIRDVENDDGEGSWVMPIITCGLFPRKKAQHRFVKHCHELDWCPRCTYVNLNNGIRKLHRSYNPRAFAVGGNYFAITIAPRLRSTSAGRSAAAFGALLTPADWDILNPDSVLFGEAHQPKVFEYPSEYELGDAIDDLPVEHRIRCFLGAAQKALQLLVRNHRCDGVRARAEPALDFVPFRAHWHWHALASSVAENNPQTLANFLKQEVDAVLLRDRIGLVCHVEVRLIPSLEDLHRWISYVYKPIDLAYPVQGLYDRHDELMPGKDIEQLLLELGLLRQRIKRTWRMKRRPDRRETGKHTYRLQRSFAAGNHRFGRGSILYESRRDRERRQRDRNAKRSRRKAGSSEGSAPLPSRTDKYY